MPFSIVEFGRCLKTSLIVGLFSNLKLLYFVCIAELLLNFVFLILISYAGTHRGWWKEINGVLAVGGRHRSSNVLEGPYQVVVLNCV